MKHLLRILAVVAPVVAVAATTIAVSPVAQNVASQHPGFTAYVVLGAGVVAAVYKALRESQQASGGTDPTPGPGSPTMQAK